jgi:uncharacterized membrane protein YfcA
VTAIVYYQLGLFIAESESILLVLMPSVMVGIPLGAYVIRRVDAETFRRICMSFDAWVVAFGLSRVLIELNLMESPWAYSAMAVTILIDTYLLYNFFTGRKAALKRLQAARASLAPSDRRGTGDYSPLKTMEVARDPFHSLSTLLGYVIGMLGIAMLVYTFSPAIFPILRLPP